MGQLVSNEDGPQSGPAVELGNSSCMASIMISSLTRYMLKTFFLPMSVMGSWAKKETGSVTICFGSGVVKTLVT